MTTYEVENRAAFAAAVRSAACLTYEEARQNPFSISLVGTHFKLTAPNGMQERGAERIAKQVMQLPQRVFRVGA